MALEGNLKEFHLADILQLIFFQHKTGVLTLQHRGERIRLLFNEGNIVGASSKTRDTADRLGRTLLGRRHIDKDQLDKALETQKTGGGKLGSILVGNGFATVEQIRDVLSFQITETLVQAFTWKDGKYEFKPEAVPIDKEIPVSINTDHFLMEGLRLVDEWSTIKDRISLETLFVKNRDFKGELGIDEMEVYELVDGTNDVGAISDLTGTDSFQVSTTLLGLLDKGAVEHKKTAEEIAAAPPPVKAMKPVPGLGYMIAVLMAAALVLSFVISYLTTCDSLKAFRASERLDEMRLRIEAERILNGRYPPSVSGRDPWGRPFVYSAGDDSYTLMSAGPDGVPDTPDDVR